MPATGPVTIRSLAAGDSALMDALRAVFSEAFEDPETYAAAPPGPEYTARLLRNDLFIALVAIEDDTVVGGIAAYELPKFEQERSEIYIYDLAVAETHRRRGIATELIAKLKEIASARDAWVIYVQADQGDDPAIALYSNLGRREDVLHFDIPAS